MLVEQLLSIIQDMFACLIFCMHENPLLPLPGKCWDLGGKTHFCFKTKSALICRVVHEICSFGICKLESIVHVLHDWTKFHQDTVRDRWKCSPVSQSKTIA